MSLKPSRTFTANVGQKSTGTAGPDQIEYDFDQAFKMFDPNQTNGGIGTDNLQDNCVTDAKMAVMTGNQATAIGQTPNQGTLLTLVGRILNRIRAAFGTTYWSDEPPITLVDTKTHVDASAPHSGHETLTGSQAKVNAHANTFAGTHGVSGNIVGTSDTQTLTNKTLGATKVSGTIDMQNNAVTSIATPTAPSDAATKGYVDSIADLTNTTQVVEEYFVIVTSDNGDGTFTYTNADGQTKTGTIGEDGEQIFTLEKKDYVPGQNLISCYINDTLRRSNTSGGIIEVDSTHVALATPEAADIEVTFVYYTSISMYAGGIIVSNAPPGNVFYGKVWIDTE